MNVLLMHPPSADHLAALRAVVPGATFSVAGSEKEAAEMITEAEVVLGNPFFLQSLPHARRLRWMQSNSVGVDLILAGAGERLEGVTLTCARGVYDDEVADHALALILALARGLHLARDDQQDRRPKELGENSSRVAADRVHAIVETPVALDQHEIGGGRSRRRGTDGFRRHHEGVEIAAGRTAGRRQPRGIDVVRSFFVGPDLQSPVNQRPHQAEADQSFTPVARKAGNREETGSIFLYREIESEAIRILLPVAEVDVETKRASFKAALDLGFRRRFQGDPGHLQVKSMREPVQDGEGHRQFLVVFDAVPGGTGYLSDIWSGGNFLDVLEEGHLAPVGVLRGRGAGAGVELGHHGGGGESGEVRAHVRPGDEPVEQAGHLAVVRAVLGLVGAHGADQLADLLRSRQP